MIDITNHVFAVIDLFFLIISLHLIHYGILNLRKIRKYYFPFNTIFWLTKLVFGEKAMNKIKRNYNNNAIDRWGSSSYGFSGILGGLLLAFISMRSLLDHIGNL